MNESKVVVGVGPVTFDDVVAVARRDAQVVISPEALDAVAASRVHIEALAEQPTPVYGVSTGFGALATRHIPHELRTQLQRSLIRCRRRQKNIRSAQYPRLPSLEARRRPFPRG